MKAIQISKTGGAEVLELREVDRPKPQAGQVLVEIKAIGVNFIDIYQRAGHFPVPLPFIAGMEAAGVVAEVGAGVSDLKVGDRVAQCGVMGAYAEFAVVPAAQLVKIPDTLKFEQAAAAMLQGITAHYLSHSSYAIKKGDDVLIHAGAGGTGLLLTQVAKMMGARVFTTVSTEEKAALSRQAGADAVILYTKDDFEKEVKRMTDGKGVHVVYDSVGKTTFDQSMRLLRPRGVMVSFGASSGPVPPYDLFQLTMMGSLTITGPKVFDFIATREELVQRSNTVFKWISEGKLKMRVEHTYPLAKAAQAHNDLEGRKTTGKVVLLP